MLAFLGDIHGSVHALRSACQYAEANGASALIQVGDLGLGPGELEHLRKKPLRFPVYFIDGNHEYFELLQRSQPTEITPYLWYVPRGSVLPLDGRLLGFLGGAGSIDKEYRIRARLRWDPREQIREEDVARFDAVERVDILVTHTPPYRVVDQNFDPLSKLQFGVDLDWVDPSSVKVERVWAKLGYPPLLCGHMHRSVRDGNCQILNENECVLVA